MAAAIRMADALLRSVGGRTVLLRMPAPAVQGDLGEQVGLAVPQFQDTPLAPVVFRKLCPTVTAGAIHYELLFSATAVEEIVGSLAYGSASVLFAQAAGVLVDDALLHITSATAAQAFGEVYLYRLALQSPTTNQL